jgi:hypothetical protein
VPLTSSFFSFLEISASFSGWFYLSIIIVISVGTFLTSIILTIQGQKVHFKPVPRVLRRLFFIRVAGWLWVQPPAPLVQLWIETGSDPDAKHEQPSKAEVLTDLLVLISEINGRLLHV